MTSLQTRGMGILIGDEHYPEISIVDDSALGFRGINLVERRAAVLP
jgi:hypothetical protein